MIKLKTLMLESQIMIDDIPKRFDDAIKEADDELKEVTDRVKKLKNGIQSVKKDWAKTNKIMDDYSWGKGKTKDMSQQEIGKVIEEYGNRLKEIGILSNYESLTM